MKVDSTLTIADASLEDWDVLVLGAGVAGAVAAREAATAGCRVLLVDKRHFPRAKVCGACLNGAALQILDELGLSSEVLKLQGPTLERVSLHVGSRSVELALPRGRAISRASLDAALIRAAINAGADFLGETTARIGDFRSDHREVKLNREQKEISVRARAVVAATGLEGIGLTETTEWTTTVRKSSRIGVGCILQNPGDQFSPGTIWMVVGQGGYVGLVVVEEGLLNIAAALDRLYLRNSGSPSLAIQQLLQQSRVSLPMGLAAAEFQGTLPLTRHTVPVASQRVFLIGDAAAYVEPFTGEGMAWALQTGRCVVPWVRKIVVGGAWREQLGAGWKAEYRRLIGFRQRFCHISTQMLRSPILTRLAISALAAWPGVARVVIDQMNAPNSQGRRIHECTS